jgi:hypothetical protein
MQNHFHPLQGAQHRGVAFVGFLLGPAGEKAYYEFHVTPSNSVLQLRFEGDGESKSLEDQMVAEPLFISETSLTHEGWSVVARIPLDGLFPTTHPEWLLSFGRYDYTVGQAKPVISSTSPHAICNFHRRDSRKSLRRPPRRISRACHPALHARRKRQAARPGSGGCKPSKSQIDP